VNTIQGRSPDQSGFTLVELLVVLLIGSIISAAAVAGIMSVTRAERFTDEYARVVDDGRLSLDRIRQELRGGRRVFPSSTPHHLYWWTDQNQDGLQQPEEKINYCVAPMATNTCVTSSQTGQFRLIRWSDAESISVARTIAATLTTTDVFSGYDTTMTETRVVTLTFVLDVQSGGTGPNAVTMDASVRLRNVA
jgi:prepilin-type N-terminal cleavage/methylation domain-containing protein